MNDRNAQRGDEALAAAAAAVAARLTVLDDEAVAADLDATLRRPESVLPAGPTSARRPHFAAWSVAGFVAAVAIATIVLWPGSGNDVLVPANPQPTDSLQPATTVDAPEPPGGSTTATVTATPPSTTVTDTDTDAGTDRPVEAPAQAPVDPSLPPADPGPCLTGVDSAATANRLFVEQMLTARSSGESLTSCLGAAPTVYDGIPPRCWTECADSDRTFSDRSIRIDEFFGPSSRDPRFSGSIAVSYESGDEFLDVVERWELTRTASGWLFDDFTIEQPVVGRGASTDVLNRYFEAIDAGDWSAVAAFLDDGAINPDERPDLRRLDPASFERDDIARALEAWCAAGCDTRPTDASELVFDGGYRLVRRGHTITAAWFEGIYSIGGLPFRGNGSTGPETFTADDLVDGVELAIDGTGMADALLFTPASLSDVDVATLEAADTGELVQSTTDDSRFDQVLLARRDPWCSRRPVIVSDIVPVGSGNSTLHFSIERPARFESAQPPDCADIDVIAIGLDFVDGTAGFSWGVESLTPIADADAVVATLDGLVLDPDRREFAIPIGTRFGGTASLVDDSIVWRDGTGSVTIITDTNIWTVEDG